MGEYFCEEKNMNLDEKFLKKEDAVVEQVDDSYLVMLKEQPDKGVYLSNTAVDIYNDCDGSKTILNIVDHICEMYDVDRSVCIDDVKDCLNELLGAELVFKV
jgi:hypothetical protein